MTEQVWVYIGRTTEPLEHWPEVGSVICATVDQPGMEASNARVIGKWMCDGLTIERVPLEWVHKHFGSTTPYSAAIP